MALLAAERSPMWLMYYVTVATASGPAYFFAENSTYLTGSTCEDLTPPKFSITTKEDCEAAASAADIKWYPTPDHFDDRPYGCHRWDSLGLGIFQGVGFNSNPYGRDAQDGLHLVCRTYPDVAAPAARRRDWSLGTVLVSGMGLCFLGQVSVALVAGFRSGRLDGSMRSLRSGSLRCKRTDSNGAAQGSKDPEKSMPDLEAAEKRDGETEKEAQLTEGTPKGTAGLPEKVPQEEQRTDDPTTAEPEANQDVFLAPTLDFLTSKALSYSMNPALLTSPIAGEGHGKEELEISFGVRTSIFKCSNYDLDVESSPYL
jgi:hypothetical protein